MSLLFRNRFRKEIMLAIALKLCALGLIWGLFFSHPLTKQLDTPQLAQHFILEK